MSEGSSGTATAAVAAGRALVVGAGIGGLTAACALREAGWDVSVFERAPAFREVGAGMTLWSNAVNALKRVGLGDAVVATGGRMRVAELRDPGGGLLSSSRLDDHEARFGAPTVCIHRAELLSLLADRLPSGVVNLGATATGFTQDATGVTLPLENGRQERSDVLIGADGLRSVVRDRLLGPAPPRFAGYTAWRGVAAFQSSDLAVGQTSEAWGCGRRFGIVPLAGGRVYWFATENGPEDHVPSPHARKHCWIGSATGTPRSGRSWRRPRRARSSRTPSTTGTPRRSGARAA